MQAHAARAADSDITFADPAAFRSFEQELQRAAGQGAGATSPQVIDETVPSRVPAQHAASSGGIPGWVWVGGFALVAFLVLRAVMRRAANAIARRGAAAAMPARASYPMQTGNGFTARATAQATTTARRPAARRCAPAFAAAGGASRPACWPRSTSKAGARTRTSRATTATSSQNWDNGQGAAASDLENRPVDFGGGGDWGGDAIASGGGFDAGGGGGDGGGW